jgi:RNA polymerase sigma-70 factor (ECF subfamily)
MYWSERLRERAVKALERELDDRLLIAAAQRERSHFAELYEQNFHRLYAYIARRVGSREEAQNLTAEVFHQALASIGSFKWQGAPFIAWLYGIASNVLSSHWQGLGKNPEQLAEDWDQGATEQIERGAILSQLVQSLLPEQRIVIVRRFIDQRSIREIAQELGRSEGAVKQLQLRALENLRQKLGRTT